MRIDEMIISNIDDSYIYESAQYIKQKKKSLYYIMKRVAAAAACLAMLFSLTVSTLSIATAAGSIGAYDVLYAMYPDVAKKLTPVNVSSKDNGIRMEVEAVHIQDNIAEIYISMKDLEHNRIDETTDLFDSCSINTSRDVIGTCSFIEYDEETGTARFLVYLEHMEGKRIEGEKLTFSVARFLSGKRELERELSEIQMEDLPVVTDVQRDVNYRGYAGEEIDSPASFLKPNKEQSFSPMEGVTVTAYGFVNGKLHIQVYYEDILRTDNHGFIDLKDDDGNVIRCIRNDAFWDESGVGSYEEYIFDVNPEEQLSELSVWGDFVTCHNLTEGNWKVTFPIENR